MMHGHEKSDLAIVAVKPANKVAPRGGAVRGGVSRSGVREPRAGTKGNADWQRTHWTQRQARVSQALERMRQAIAVWTRGAAVCGKAARGLAGGARATSVPTATTEGAAQRACADFTLGGRADDCPGGRGTAMSCPVAVSQILKPSLKAAATPTLPPRDRQARRLALGETRLRSHGLPIDDPQIPRCRPRAGGLPADSRPLPAVHSRRRGLASRWTPTLTLPSLPAEATRSPVGEQATAMTSPSCASRVCSNRCSTTSPQPNGAVGAGGHQICRLSGVQVVSVTWCRWPCRSLAGSPVRASRILMVETPTPQGKPSAVGAPRDVDGRQLFEDAETPGGWFGFLALRRQGGEVPDLESGTACNCQRGRVWGPDQAVCQVGLRSPASSPVVRSQTLTSLSFPLPDASHLPSRLQAREEIGCLPVANERTTVPRAGSEMRMVPRPSPAARCLPSGLQAMAPQHPWSRDLAGRRRVGRHGSSPKIFQTWPLARRCEPIPCGAPGKGGHPVPAGLIRRHERVKVLPIERVEVEPPPEPRRSVRSGAGNHPASN